MTDGLNTTILTRRSFLRASTLITVVLGLSATVFAQEPAKPGKEPNRQPEKKPDTPPDSKPDDGSDTTSEDKSKETKIDQDGREYRLCPLCGANMYKTGSVWSCEFCEYIESDESGSTTRD
jgi:hypothetical protein